MALNKSILFSFVFKAYCNIFLAFGITNVELCRLASVSFNLISFFSFHVSYLFVFPYSIHTLLSRSFRD